MACWIPSPPRRDGPEWLDDMQSSNISTDALSDALAEVRRLNWLGGGTRTVLRYVNDLLPGQQARLLDVGTGAADTPVALLRWANRAGVRLEVTGLDVSPQVLDVARQYVGRDPIRLVLGDARTLPFPDGSFDLAISIGLLHHFDEHEVCTMLREMWRVVRVGIIALDLERSYHTYLLSRLALATVVRNPITRHDGLVSVQRSYTATELLSLARSAGCRHADVHRHLPVAQALVARKDQPS